MSNFYKKDKEIIKGFLAGKKEEYKTISSWVCQVVKFRNWGLEKHFDDIIQDVVLKIYENLREGKFKYHSSLKTYVYKIAKFTCIDYLRKYSSKEQREVELLEVRGNKNPDEKTKQKEREEIFWRIYKLMPQECQELWRMVFFENLSYSQIAEELNIKEGTVKSRFFRCKGKAIQIRKKLIGKRNLFDSDTTIKDGKGEIV